MCPICWAMMMAAFSTYLSATAAVIAGKDWATLLGATLLLAMATIHSFNLVAVPWWSFGSLAGILTIRVGWLILRHREGLLIVTACRHAKNVAAPRCPNRNRES
jgi:hypothetical protein